jgi:arsenite methyltransferase
MTLFFAHPWSGDPMEIEPTGVYNVEDARAFLTSEGVDLDAITPQVEGKFMSAFVRATKPEKPCCGPSCCAPEEISKGQ